MQTRLMTCRRRLWLAAQLCVLAMPLVLGGCDKQYTDRFGVTHYDLSHDEVLDLQAHDIADEGAGMLDKLVVGDLSSVDQIQVNNSIGPNIQGPVAGTGFISGSSSPPSFCTPPCGTFIIPP